MGKMIIDSISGSAVIITPPQNMTKVDGEKVTFPCEWRANPANATVSWYRDGIPVRQISSLESRIETPSEGSLIISAVHMDDSGFYECRVTNGIGETQSAVCYLNVECTCVISPSHSYCPYEEKQTFLVTHAELQYLANIKTRKTRNSWLE